jgi:hypothetical protein
MHGSSSRRIAGVLGGALLILALMPAAVLAATAPTITSANSTTFTVGVAGSFTVTATGTPTPALSKTAGFLPTGVTFTDSTTGTTTIAGTPAAGTLPGAYTITITASNGTLPDATQYFTLHVNPAPNYLYFATQPGGGAAGAIWTQQPVVQVLDSLNRVVTTDNSTYITLAISTNPAGGTLSCTSGTTLQVTQGVASFYGCRISVGSSSSYTLGATSSPVWIGATSSPFYVGGSYQQLVFATQPGGGAAGAVWTQQPVVKVVDASNQVVTTDNSTYVYLAIGTNPAGGTLSCTSGTSLRVTNGVASFYGCSINVASTTYYTLGATSSPAWTAATSSPFYVGGSQQLVFTTQPGGGAAGAIWTQQPVVKVVNSLNQVVTTDNSTYVYLAISTNPAGGTLSCTSGTTLRVTSGAASFYGCSINVASSGYYTLGASSSPVWTAATSSAFYVTGLRPSLAISVSSSLGLKPLTGYTTATPKTTTVGKYVTWKFTGGAALVGQRVNVMVAKRVNGVWGLPAYLKSAWADANGLVTFAWTLNTAGAINVRVQWPGNATYAVSTSKALGAYWK